MRARIVDESYRILGIGRFVLTYVAPPMGRSQHEHAPGEKEHTPQESHWLTVARRTALQLAPRGVNPTSFRLFEAMQLGLVPVYVYDDGDEQPWLPYHDWGGGLRPDGSLARVSAAPRASGPLWQRAAIVLRASEYSAFLTDALPDLMANETWYEGKRAFVRAARDAYFTYEAVTRHIYWFLRDPERADIRCQQPPRSFFGGRANADQSWMQPLSKAAPSEPGSANAAA